MNRVLFALASVVATATAANATILASAPLFAGPSQNAAVCVLFNAGLAPVTITKGQIVAQNGAALTLLPSPYSNCGATLAADNICGIAATVANNTEYACRFVLSPDGAEIRGSFEIRNGYSPGAVLLSAPLR